MSALKMFCFLKLNIISICIISHTFASLENEPKCVSQFDYEYKVIQKLVELDNKIKDQQKAINKLTEECEVNKKKLQEVAFSAYLVPDMTAVTSHRVIVFDLVQNNIGDAYNGKTGIFVCKIPGVYVFYWVVTNKDHTWMDSELVINGEEKSQAFSDAGNHADYAVATNVVTAELKFGDQVWIRSGTFHNGNIAGERRTSFSGWLLYGH